MALLLHPKINKEQNLRGQYAVVWSDLALFCDFQKRQIADNQVCKFNSKKLQKAGCSRTVYAQQHFLFLKNKHLKKKKLFASLLFSFYFSFSCVPIFG